MFRRKWVSDYYKEEEDFPPRCITCKKCSSNFTDKHNRVRDFAIHLRCVHNKTELNKHPQRGILEEKFFILNELGRGQCKKCGKQIDFDLGVYLLENHMKICQNDDYIIYKKMHELAPECKIWDKYNIIDQCKVTCIRCQNEVKIMESRYVEIFRELILHWHVHDRQFLYHMGILQPPKKTIEELKKALYEFLEKQAQREIRSASNEPIPGPSTSSSVPISKVRRMTPSKRQREEEASNTSSGDLQEKSTVKEIQRQKLLRTIKEAEQIKQTAQRKLDELFLLPAEKKAWIEKKSAPKESVPGPSTSIRVSVQSGQRSKISRLKLITPSSMRDDLPTSSKQKTEEISSEEITINENLSKHLEIEISCNQSYVKLRSKNLMGEENLNIFLRDSSTSTNAFVQYEEKPNIPTSTPRSIRDGLSTSSKQKRKETTSSDTIQEPTSEISTNLPAVFEPDPQISEIVDKLLKERSLEHAPNEGRISDLQQHQESEQQLETEEEDLLNLNEALELAQDDFRELDDPNEISDLQQHQESEQQLETEEEDLLNPNEALELAQDDFRELDDPNEPGPSYIISSTRDDGTEPEENQETTTQHFDKEHS